MCFTMDKTGDFHENITGVKISLKRYEWSPTLSSIKMQLFVKDCVEIQIVRKYKLSETNKAQYKYLLPQKMGNLWESLL